MDEASYIVLALIGIVAFNAYRQGALGSWLRAKFLNATPPLPVDGADVDGTASRSGGIVDRIVRGILGRPLSTALDPTDAGALFGADRGDHSHAGVDWSVPIGTPVQSAARGRVTVAGPASEYGNAVYVDHGNGLQTRYAHLSDLLVKVGDVVTAGQRLALSGNTGHSTGPHLHFEVRQDGSPVDPLGALHDSADNAAWAIT